MNIFEMFRTIHRVEQAIRNDEENLQAMKKLEPTMTSFETMVNDQMTKLEKYMEGKSERIGKFFE
ncbi:hypothetical protein [Thalassobacillus hwangdonensis]|uniref:Uncharacterized protein n=1 Tax=Thalassobacillus hwangdonensis TaxID=546108 RepID=A0ABW3KXS4_9BACI